MEDSQARLPIHLILSVPPSPSTCSSYGALVWLSVGARTAAHAASASQVAELSEVHRWLEATIIAENEGLTGNCSSRRGRRRTLDQRRRMAREIHDTLAQGLTGIVTQLQAADQAASRTPGEPTGRRRHVDAATRLARESLTEARRSVDALRPEPLVGTPSRVRRWLASPSGGPRSNGLPAQVTTTGTARPIPPGGGIRAAARGAGSTRERGGGTRTRARVGLTISYMENEVALDVRDDGACVDPSLQAGAWLRPCRDAAAHRGAVRHAASRVGAGRRHGDLGVRADRARVWPARERGRRGGSPIRPSIADDHPVVRDGLSGMFAADPDFSVGRVASDGSPGAAARRRPCGPM